MTKNNQNNELDVVIGERVKKCRKEMQLSQEELASRVRNLPENNGKERTPQHIGYIERGTRKLSIEWARLLSKVFGVRTEYLLCEDDFKTDFEKKSFPILQDFLDYYKRSEAIKKYCEVWGISFEYYVEGLDTETFKEKYKDKTLTEGLEDGMLDDICDDICDMVASVIVSKNRKYKVIDKKGNLIKIISEEEYKHFVNDISDYFEFKLEKLL